VAAFGPLVQLACVDPVLTEGGPLTLRAADDDVAQVGTDADGGHVLRTEMVVDW
jgi:hypothetical protein